MKKIFITLFVVPMMFVCAAMAGGEYTGAINDKSISIVFIPGPFGPDEQGDAKVTFDGSTVAYKYRAETVNAFVIYTVDGLCSFVGTEQVIEAYHPLNIQLHRHVENLSGMH